jgi:benzoyl-CoA reductase/2-hydroxyglutaryl-CoA dehydratase subunit BcrC/BadD/HgdB
VIAETTCDGKKKMFELVSHTRPMHVMDLPQLPDEEEAKDNWTVMTRKLQGFLEKTFNRTIRDEDVEREIRDTNRKNRMMDRVFEFATLKPSPISWKEVYDLTWLALSADTEHMAPIVENALMKLEKRVENGVFFGRPDSPRVLVTGCPVGGDATKVFKIIEEAGGVVVCLDACTGMKAYQGEIEEGTPDPYRAISERYLKIPCSCMTPNTRRLVAMDELIARFRPDVVVDVVLQACHSYNVEAHKVKDHVKSMHNLPYLKIETDYSLSDAERIRTRVEGVFESL